MVTVIAAMRTFAAQLVKYEPAGLYGLPRPIPFSRCPPPSSRLTDVRALQGSYLSIKNMLKRRRRYTVVPLLLMTTITACARASFTDVARDRAKLLGSLESYMSLEALKKQIEPSLLPWTVTEDNKLDPNDRRPPHNIYVVAIKGYTHLGESGSLEVSFFNDRLVEARFFPDNFDRYVAALNAEQRIAFNSSQEAVIPPNTRVWISTDFGGKRFVGWGDVRLQQEQIDWIERFS